MEENYVTVVSGLPRSGTSMMMRMMEFGGMPVLVDNVRQADADNPKGYYEFEPVKSLPENTAWLPDAQGKAVKMVYALLYQLPKDYSYRIIFMRRDLREVLKSQKVMLERMGNQDMGPDDKKMEEMFLNHLQQFEEWSFGQDNIKILNVSYNELMKDGTGICEQVSDFLDNSVDAERMKSVLDPSLYRNKKGNITGG